jgi:hypothetical protein
MLWVGAARVADHRLAKGSAKGGASRSSSRAAEPGLVTSPTGYGSL